MQFTDLGLAEPIFRAVADAGYDVATPIQAQTIPQTLAGRDVLGSAQTGTGKTAAFALPVLNRLLESGAIASTTDQAGTARRGTSRRRRRGRPRNGNANDGPTRTAAGGPAIRCLALCPTRELADQIRESFATYGRHTSIRTAEIVGGVSQHPQVQALERGVEVCIATPGRLLDLIGQGHVDLSRVETLILDEADRMLDMGFIHDIRKVIKRVPERRQTLLFSATLPPAIRELSAAMLYDPVVVSVSPESSTAENVEQTVCHVQKPNKTPLLVEYVQRLKMQRGIVFTRTKHGADKVTRQLQKAGVGAVAIHGNKSQNQRRAALERFKAGKLSVLVATDVAARGIDVDHVSHVVNYDVPRDAESYVHRIGRTARAGAAGSAITFCENEERAFLGGIERLIQQKLVVREDVHGLTEAEPKTAVPAPPKQGGGQPRRGQPKAGVSSRKSQAAPPKARGGGKTAARSRHPHTHDNLGGSKPGGRRKKGAQRRGGKDQRSRGTA